jgi:Protein kinase domain
VFESEIKEVHHWQQLHQCGTLSARRTTANSGATASFTTVIFINRCRLFCQFHILQLSHTHKDHLDKYCRLMVNVGLRHPHSKLPHQLEDTFSSNFNALQLEDESSRKAVEDWALGPCFAQVRSLLKLVNAKLHQTNNKWVSTKRSALLSLCLLQQGSYARVHTGFCYDSHTEIAVKVISLQGRPGSNRRRNSQLEAVQEVKLLQSLQSHKNIIQYIGTVARGDEFFILQEKVSSSMRDLLRAGRPFAKSTAQHYAHQVLEALEFLHSKCIAHRDVKPANVLVDQSSGTIKLIDFGACLELEGHSTLAVSMAGTPRYCAPEVLQNEAHGVAVDIWSFGCTYLQVCVL